MNGWMYIPRMKEAFIEPKCTQGGGKRWTLIGGRLPLLGTSD